jgi:hypothetical protein
MNTLQVLCVLMLAPSSLFYAELHSYAKIQLYSSSCCEHSGQQRLGWSEKSCNCAGLSGAVITVQGAIIQQSLAWQ